METINSQLQTITHQLSNAFKIKSTLLLFIFSMFLFSCSQTENKTNTSAPSVDSETTEIDKKTEKSPQEDTVTEAPSAPALSENLTALETKHSEMLKPIASLKSSNPKMYSFIVSWLETNYKTPDWTNYNSDTWQQETKVKGIDCSGFARVMQDKIFNKKIAGSSQMLLDDYCNKVAQDESKMGDLIFFKNPYSESDRIVHVGVYLMDNYFVHATSTESAKIGLGLKVDSIKDKRWNDGYVATGRVKS